MLLACCVHRFRSSRRWLRKNTLGTEWLRQAAPAFEERAATLAEVLGVWPAIRTVLDSLLTSPLVAPTTPPLPAVAATPLLSDEPATASAAAPVKTDAASSGERRCKRAREAALGAETKRERAERHECKRECKAAPAKVKTEEIARQQAVWRRVSLLAGQLADVLQTVHTSASFAQTLSALASSLVVEAVRRGDDAETAPADVVEVSD